MKIIGKNLRVIQEGEKTVARPLFTRSYKKSLTDGSPLMGRSLNEVISDQAHKIGVYDRIEFAGVAEDIRLWLKKLCFLHREKECQSR